MEMLPWVSMATGTILQIYRVHLLFRNLVTFTKRKHDINYVLYQIAPFHLQLCACCLVKLIVKVPYNVHKSIAPKDSILHHGCRLPTGDLELMLLRWRQVKLGPMLLGSIAPM